MRVLALVLGLLAGGFVLGFVTNEVMRERGEKKVTKESLRCNAMIDRWESLCTDTAARHLGGCNGLWTEIEAGCLGGEHDPGVGE